MNQSSNKFRYSVVSGICFLLGATLIPAFASLGLHYAFATLAAFTIVALVGFILHSKWTYQVERSARGFVRYFSVMLLNLPLTVILIGLAHDFAQIPLTIAAPMTSILLFVWNYLAVRWAVVRKVEGNET